MQKHEIRRHKLYFFLAKILRRNTSAQLRLIYNTSKKYNWRIFLWQTTVKRVMISSISNLRKYFEFSPDCFHKNNILCYQCVCSPV